MGNVNYLDDNDGDIPDNIEFNAVTATDYTIWINQDSDGNTTETATKKVIATSRATRMGRGFTLRPADQDVSIVSIGHITFRDPITVSASTAFNWIKRCPNFRNIVIRTQTANSLIRLVVL